MTGEDFGYKSGVVEKSKFRYSALGRVFNKGLDEKDKKRRILENIKILNLIMKSS